MSSLSTPEGKEPIIFKTKVEGISPEEILRLNSKYGNEEVIEVPLSLVMPNGTSAVVGEAVIRGGLVYATLDQEKAGEFLDSINRGDISSFSIRPTLYPME